MTSRTLLRSDLFLRRGLAVGLCVWGASLLVVLAAAPEVWWMRHYHAWPEPFGIAAIALCAGLIFLPGGGAAILRGRELIEAST